ncbi:glycoside hydrolase family 9 protein [Ruminococcus sp. XPD3002]|uniref:glycoside hydrolase family 9 protein n=1 Tax=Ruminococcus sp. XPD3002 TaxID=1452269 RepID=UPI000919B440|nr:Cellulose binding domain-containing protein [Ruminococcus flavefaciens]
MKLKKLAAAVSALLLASGTASAMPVAPTADAAGTYNYAEALQKSMFFYEVQQSGVLPEWNEVSWRGDSMENDGVPGGWYDAGDHLKFTLTNAYSATLLGWGLIEYGDAVDKAGLGDLYRNNLKFALDYIVACDRGSDIVYMIGDGNFDHVWWGSAEVYMRKYKLKEGADKRPVYTCQDSCIEGQMAAALAAGYMIYKDENYLKHAKDLFERADAEKALGEDAKEHAYYKPSSYIDDLFFAANWLYKATGDKTYLDKATSYVPNLDKEQQSTELKFTWGHCWDDTTQGAMLLYAQNTGDQQWIDQVSHHLDYWTTGYGGKVIDKTPNGFSWLFQWGSLRHATTTAFLASLAADTIYKDAPELQKKYNDFAKFTMDYCFGDNENKMSYVLGMGENNPKAPHHRTASGIHDDHWNELGQKSGGDEGYQTEYAHTLYGALVGGPSRDGSYKDVVSSYENSEVAIDYNAGYTAELCALMADYGGTPLADFPEIETPKWDEWQVAAVLNGQPADSYTEVKAWAMNHTAWPARVVKDLKYRYYFDVSELLEKGMSIDQITVETKSQQYSEGEPGYGVASGPYKYEGDPTGNTYYAEIAFEDGRAIMPTGQSEHRDEVQFRISIPDAIDGVSTKGAWDYTNDWSYLGGLADASDLKKSDSLNKHITMYADGVLVWGEEPDGTTPTVSTPVRPTPTPVTTTEAAPAPVTTKAAPAPVTTAAPTTAAPLPATTTTVTPTTTAPVTSPGVPGNPGSQDIGGNDVIVWGDATCDGDVSLSDALLILQYVANSSKYPITEKGLKQADVDGVPGVTGMDSLEIQKKDARLISKFPVE